MVYPVLVVNAQKKKKKKPLVKETSFQNVMLSVLVSSLQSHLFPTPFFLWNLSPVLSFLVLDAIRCLSLSKLSSSFHFLLLWIFRGLIKKNITSPSLSNSSGVPVVDGSSVHDPSSEPKSSGRSGKGSSKKAKTSESSTKQPRSPLDEDSLIDVEGKEKRDTEKGSDRKVPGGKKKRYRLEEKWTNCGWD